MKSASSIFKNSDAILKKHKRKRITKRLVGLSGGVFRLFSGSKNESTNNFLKFLGAFALISQTNQYLKNYNFKKIDKLITIINSSKNNKKRNALLQLTSIINKLEFTNKTKIIFKYLPSSSASPSLGKDLYEHSGYYGQKMNIRDIMALQSRQNCRCGLELVTNIKDLK